MNTADKQLAQKLGLPVKSIRTWRETILEKGRHYDGQEYTTEGIKAIKGQAGIDDGEETPAPEPIFTLLTVIRRLPNPTWVIAKDPEGKQAQLRVRSSLRIAQGMKLQSVRDGSTWKCIHNGYAAR